MKHCIVLPLSDGKPFLCNNALVLTIRMFRDEEMKVLL
jgi:hypothetical protein